MECRFAPCQLSATGKSPPEHFARQLLRGRYRWLPGRSSMVDDGPARESGAPLTTSWQAGLLDGMEPDRQTVEEINAFLRSGLSASEYLRKLKGD